MARLRFWQMTAACALLLPQLAQCQQDTGPPGNPDVTHYRYRIGHSVAVLANSLYVDGGELVSGEPGNSTTLQSVVSNKTALIPLNVKWNTSSPGTTVLERGESSLRVTETSLWPDESNGALYSWGGSVATQEEVTQNWTLRVLRSSWTIESTVPSASGSAQARVVRTRSGSWTTCGGRGLLLGGVTPYSQLSTDFAAVPGLLTLDLAAQAWANATAAGFAPAAGASPGTHLGGAAVCLPTVGAGGVAAFLGGKQAAGLAANATWLDVSFEKLYVYDVARGEFHAQSTTQDAEGARPGPRTEFCAVATRSSSSSYEIFVFGGRNGAALADVHVLTIPGFRWFKVAAAADSPRYQQGCAVVGRGGRQMLSVGGIESWETKFSTGLADPWKNGLKVFDMTTWNWSDSYDPDVATYEMPTTIRSWYDAGGLDSVKWDNDSTKALFQQTNTGSTNTTPTTMSESRSSSVLVGLIAGVVGGVAVLALIAVGIFLCLRRRRRQKASQQDAAVEVDATQQSDGVQATTSECQELDDKLGWERRVVHELPQGSAAVSASEQDAHERAHEMPDVKDPPRELPNNEIEPPQELPASPARPDPLQEKCLGGFIPSPESPKDGMHPSKSPWAS